MSSKKEQKLALETTCLLESYKLPDGRELTFDRERFEAANILFDPPAHMEAKGISDMLFDMIQQKAAVDIRLKVTALHSCLVDQWHTSTTRCVTSCIVVVWVSVLLCQLYRKIVLSGGSTMYPGFSTRLHADISRRYLNEVLKGDTKRMAVR